VDSALFAREELQRRARTEFLRRAGGTPEHAELVRRDIIARLHEKQRLVVDMVFAFVRFVAAECSRRAGKTHLAAAVIILKLLAAKHGQEVVYVAPTLARGKELIWLELMRMLEEYGLVWKSNESTGKMWTPSGVLFRIVGLNNKKQVGKVARGGNTVLVVTDETQEFPHLLEQFLNAIGPALAESLGCCLAMGTPTVNESDYWAQICDGGEGFQLVHWTLRDNPYLGRDPDELLADERKRHGWSEDHPNYVREYLGKRCRDASNMVLELDEARNVVTSIRGYVPSIWSVPFDPAHDALRARWRHFIGIDFGFTDATAWVVLAAPTHGPEVYAVHCEKESGLTWDQVIERTAGLVRRYRPQGVVGDSASGGKTFLETFNVRYARTLGVYIRAASKHDKPASIAVMNTELRKGRLKFLAPVTSQLVTEARALQWENPERTEILEGSAYPEDFFDSLRYAFNDFWAFAHAPQGKQESEDDKRIRERNEREAARQATVHRLARR
jgi:hypothetical protein